MPHGGALTTGYFAMLSLGDYPLHPALGSGCAIRVMTLKGYAGQVTCGRAWQIYPVWEGALPRKGISAHGERFGQWPSPLVRVHSATFS
jgi:hypothetical protein